MEIFFVETSKWPCDIFLSQVIFRAKLPPPLNLGESMKLLLLIVFLKLHMIP